MGKFLIPLLGVLIHGQMLQMTPRRLPFNSTFGHVIYNCFLGYCFVTGGCTELDMFGDVEPFQLQYGRTSKSYARGAMNGLSRDVNADIAGPGGGCYLSLFLSFYCALAGGRLCIVYHASYHYSIYLTGRRDS